MPKRLFSGRVLVRAVCGLAAAAALASAQAPPQKAVSKKAAVHRANELTLAGLRPGLDTAKRGEKLYGEYIDLAKDESQAAWRDNCGALLLVADLEKNDKIQVIRVSHASFLLADCAAVPRSPWKTGRGLRVYDPVTRLLQLYGEPDSKSPSTRNGQDLELWYYAFDWAGPDVPQVMEVLCTREKEGQPGRVEEITLAASSL
jgi:hypothetical protein